MRKVLIALIAVIAAMASLLAPAQAVSPTDPFYRYTGTKPLSQYAPGAVLRTRTVNYSIQGLALPLKAIQILFRTTNALGAAAVGVTTVVRPLGASGPIKQVVSYQSFYDSLNPADEPSVAIAGGSGAGEGIANVETLLFAPLLLSGKAINIPDTEGQSADFAAGPEYGRVTLDSIRAISRTSATQIPNTAKVALIGYSGGAIGSEWAAEQAKTYAPDVAPRIVGTAVGGVLVDPAHNLTYVGGSLVWSGVIPMAIIGISRSYHINLTQYLNAYGRTVVAALQKAAIADALGHYPGLTWQKMALPAYQNPYRIPAFVNTINKLIMSTGGTPSAPLFIGQGNGGYQEGTLPSAKYGAGDGVMIAGDVRTLARTYCARGIRTQYVEYPLSHIGSTALWLPQAYGWILDRFAGKTAPSSCGKIAAGNSIAKAVLAP
ncbi:putative inactive lipase [Nocardioides baekrokdamisoli]|uniref:Putative inactive lipase n=1 Tax=Nocardioides baekrokdamisoli TaxID=1804624 RepID=A0A3G9IJQ9_9ACTN|nr:lipase family protein [Nocardioides baekrokdamisoli]BBH18526.1 putative inactive lipase [Nocardioides baekrokdamisoli]